MKNKIKKIATALLAFTVGCVSLTGCNVRQDTIRFGAAGVGGGYYAFATAYTQLANAEDAEMKFNIKSTAGSMANLRLLSEGYVDVAIAQADLATAAYYGTDEKGNPIRDTAYWQAFIPRRARLLYARIPESKA